MKTDAARPGPITEFTGEFAFLSNFYPSPVSWDGLTYPTVEHAYQAAKSTREEDRVRIQCCRTPGQAKHEGRRVVLRPSWEGMKCFIMLRLLQQKFAPRTALAEKLIATEGRELIEGNWWGDTYWGVCRGQGKNRLGNLLMLVRGSLYDMQNWPRHAPTL